MRQRPHLLRAPNPDDAAGIARLLPDLGYAGAPTDVARRLAAIAQQPDHWVQVAERDGVLVGLCETQGIRLIASDGYAEVHALVVAQAERRTGIGSALLRAAVEWAFAQSYTRVRLRSGLHREEAHRFYEAQGFSRARASYAFELDAIDGSNAQRDQRDK